MNTMIKDTLLKEHTDEEIMKKVAKGDLDMLGLLFERHHKHLYSFLFKMSGDRSLSEDIVQEVFYNILKYRTTYKDGKFVTWMFIISRNILAKHKKRATKVKISLDSVFNKYVSNETEDFSELYIALKKLNPDDMEILILNRLQEIKYSELADIVDSTPNAVKTRVNRALKKLRSIYFENI